MRISTFNFWEESIQCKIADISHLEINLYDVFVIFTRFLLHDFYSND